MQKTLSFFIKVSIVAFLAVILLVYSFLPQNAGLLFSNTGIITYSVAKGDMFYMFLISFSMLQTVLYLFKNWVLKRNRFQKRPALLSWFQQMWISINLFLLILTGFIGLANNTGNYTFQSIQILAYIAPSLVLLSFFSLPVYLVLEKNKKF